MIIARHIPGKMTNLRTLVRYLLIGLFVATPWIQYNGRPLVLLDIDQRRFYFPGVVIWPQEFYYLLLLLLISGLALFLFTALFGRLWCGWACPQTVYTDLFDSIGRLLFPSHFGKRSEKVVHRIIYHTLWILLSVVLTFHFIAYFVPATDMIDSVWNMGLDLFSLAWPYFLISTALLFYLDIAFFREHACIYICPYARFQSVMMDDDSIIIAYDYHRGEPRRQTKNKITAASPAHYTPGVHEQEGECTACNLCTMVCPTGIDIRNGLQVSCIQCTRCIDACAREMSKTGAKSLVQFASLSFNNEKAKARFIRTRTLVYTVLMSALVGFFSFLMYVRVPIQGNIIRDPRITPHLSNEFAMNYYKVNIANLKEKPAQFEVKARLVRRDGEIDQLETITGMDLINVDSNELKHLQFALKGHIKEGARISHKKNIPVDFVIQDANDPSNQKTIRTLFTIPRTTGA